MEVIEEFRPVFNWNRENESAFDANDLSLPEGFLSVQEVHKRTGTAISTVNMYCRKKKFPNAVKFPTIIGSVWLIPETDLELVKKRGRGRPKNN